MNMKAVTSLQYCFRPKIHEQAMKCWKVHYHGAKAMNYFFTNLSVLFFGLLRPNSIELVVLLIDHLTSWQEFMMHYAIKIK